MQPTMDGAWMASDLPVVHQGAVGNSSPEVPLAKDGNGIWTVVHPTAVELVLRRS